MGLKNFNFLGFECVQLIHQWIHALVFIQILQPIQLVSPSNCDPSLSLSLILCWVAVYYWNNGQILERYGVLLCGFYRSSLGFVKDLILICFMFNVFVSFSESLIILSVKVAGFLSREWINVIV